jgi:predicted RNase H-like HicB family nuclease
MRNKSGVKKVPRVEPPYSFERYAHIVSPLSMEDGGGFLFTLPDFPGCMSDGETIDEAIANGRDAFLAVVAARADAGDPIPAPSFSPESVNVPDVSGKFVARMPKTTHAELVRLARAEGVSLNTLVLAFIAEGLGRRHEDRAAG